MFHVQESLYYNHHHHVSHGTIGISNLTTCNFTWLFVFPPPQLSKVLSVVNWKTFQLHDFGCSILYLKHIGCLLTCFAPIQRLFNDVMPLSRSDPAYINSFNLHLSLSLYISCIFLPNWKFYCLMEIISIRNSMILFHTEKFSTLKFCLLCYLFFLFLFFYHHLLSIYIDL